MWSTIDVEVNRELTALEFSLPKLPDLRASPTMNYVKKFSRRTMLYGAGTATAAATLTASNIPIATAHRPEAILSPPPFVHGVASGDPLPNSAVLWTRITTNESQVTVAWQVSTTETFAEIAAEGTVLTDSTSDYTIHIDPLTLRPGTVYFYRFEVLTGQYAGKVSPIGRTKTAPAPGSALDELTFAVASCANWESGYFSAYRDMANRASLFDATLFLGDYIYEYATGEYAGNGPVRIHDPKHEITTLDDYRRRYARYRTDHDLQAAHAALPWIVVWDDHETANNSWRDGAENHQASEGNWLSRRNAAMQAYFEWMPVRATSPSDNGHIYRSFTFGDLAELTIMDLRTYRDMEAFGSVSTATNPDRTMLGSEQYQWLTAKIESSNVAWNVLGNSVMFSPLNLMTLEQDPHASSVSQVLSENITNLPLNGDQWDGYSAERTRLLDTLAKHHHSTGANPLFLTGDIHTEWAHSINRDGAPLGAELVCSSISAPNVDEELGLTPTNPVTPLAQRIIQAANPHCRHVNLVHHGYAYVTIRRSQVEMHWLRVSAIGDPNATVSDAIALTWEKGKGFMS